MTEVQMATAMSDSVVKIIEVNTPESVKTKMYLEAVQDRASTKGSLIGMAIGVASIFIGKRFLAPIIAEKMCKQPAADPSVIEVKKEG